MRQKKQLGSKEASACKSVALLPHRASLLRVELKMAGAASLQKDREINSQSELGQIAQGYKPPYSNGVNFMLP